MALTAEDKAEIAAMIAAAQQPTQQQQAQPVFQPSPMTATIQGYLPVYTQRILDNEMITSDLALLNEIRRLRVRH